MLRKKFAALICMAIFSFHFLEAQLQPSFLNLPLRFEKNEGQKPAEVKYYAHKKDCSLFFTSESVVMVLPNKSGSNVLKIEFVEANHSPTLEGIDELQCKSHYFIGNDAQKWVTNVTNVAKVSYKNLYPGIDVIFYGNEGMLEYDICVAPGADPQNARLHIEGAKSLSVDESGNLQIHTCDDQNAQMMKPFIFQETEGQKIPIEGSFVLLSQQEVGFVLGAYDTSKYLVIDPILAYSTYFGGSADEIGFGIAVDAEGFVYVTGSTSSTDFPTTPGAYQNTLGGVSCCFITKLNPLTSTLIYSTYLGNSDLRGCDPVGVCVDREGNAYVLGTTDSSTFPTTPGAFQTTLNGLTNCYITKLNPTGSGLMYSTYLGGSAVAIGDQAGDLCIDSNGNAFLVGSTNSPDFPVTIGAYQTSLAGTGGNCFVTKLNATGTNLIYSTYLGGSTTTFGGDQGNGIAVDSTGNVYVTGQANSSDFPTTAGAFQNTLRGTLNAFITKINATGTNLVYSTYLGGSSYDLGFGIALDSTENAFVSGLTTSSDFPTTPNAFQPVLISGTNVFITKLNTAGSGLVYSTYLGGDTPNSDIGRRIRVGKNGNAYVGGGTSSSNFPTTPDAFQTTLKSNVSAFITEMDFTGSNLVYSTYLGAITLSGPNGAVGFDIALDCFDNIYVTGRVSTTDFPVTPNAFQTTLQGTSDCFISIFIFNPAPPSNFKGKLIKNMFLTQTEYINHLSWSPSPDPAVVGYKIFRNGVLNALIPARGPYFYNDHDATKKQNVTYTIVSTNIYGAESVPLSVTLYSGEY